MFNLKRITVSYVNNLCPRAPCTLNTSAPAYERLRSLFEHDDVENLQWESKNNTYVTARLVTNLGATMEDIFTSSEMEAVCPGLFYLVTNKNIKNIADTRRPRKTEETFWNHCKAPGLLMSRDGEIETYLNTLIEILGFDEDSKTVSAHLIGYKLRLRKTKLPQQLLTPFKKLLSRKKSVEPPCLVVQSGPLTEFIYTKINLYRLENVWPGFTHRLHLGLGLGLTGGDLVSCAINDVCIISDNDTMPLPNMECP